jgi:hypothetical protein
MGIATFPAASGGVTQKIQEFTSTTSWTAPSNVTTVEVFLVGGGGGGGYVNNEGSGVRHSGSGGAGGEVIRRILPVTPGTSYTVTIGAGGAGGSTSTASGGTGGNTSFGSLLTAFGSYGGQSSNVPVGQYSFTQRGGGSNNQSSSQTSGSGGGAGGPATIQSGTGNVGTMQFLPVGITNAGINQRSVAGGINFTGTVSYSVGQTAGIGIDGFGNGGAPGLILNTSASNSAGFAGWSGTGSPGWFVTNNSNRSFPVAASANTGDGGHGGTTAGADTPVNGSAGGSGYARIVFWS